MALVNKQDSNFTELRYAVEETPGVLPVTPEWLPLEPNEYKDFGGTLVTKARTPITGSRQRKKGVVLDLEAAGGFIQDVTPTNSLGLMEAFLFAEARKKTELDVATVNASTDAYEPASGGTAFELNDLLFAEDFDDSANNGLKLVDAAASAASVPVSGDLTAATTQSGKITRVGYQFGTGQLIANATASDFSRLETTGLTAASKNLAASGNPSDGDTVTIGSTVYSFESGALDAPYKVDIGGDAEASLLNLVHAINGTGTPGTNYATGTVLHPDVTAAEGTGDSIDVTAKVKGYKGNSIALAESSSNLAWDSGATALSGGVGRDLRTLGLIPGEFIFIGDGSDAAYSFATAEDNGFCRVREVGEEYIILDKTQFAFADDTGTGKTVRVYLGHAIKNESDKSLIVKKTLQFERQLGAPDDALPAQIQSEYITRAMASELSLDGKTADFLLMDMSFLGGTHETRTGATGVKSGTRPDLVESDAFNTTSDVSLIKMALVEDGESCPDPLFAYLTDLSLTVNNNLKQNKAISVLGAFDVTPGTFEVAAEVTAYFQSVEALTAAKDNASVTIEAHFAKANKGLSIDLPLVVLSNARADVKLDEPVMLPLTCDAATAKLIDSDMDYTLFMMFWTYLPDVAQ